MALNPFLSKAVANRAVTLARSAMQNEAVRTQLRDAPDAVTRWARAHQGEMTRAGVLSNLSRLDPTARFGQAALGQRLDALEVNLALVFEDPANPARAETVAAVAELRRAVVVAAPLPLIKRKKVFLRIDGELGALEQALVDAVLPPNGPASAPERAPDDAGGPDVGGRDRT